MGGTKKIKHIILFISLVAFASCKPKPAETKEELPPVYDIVQITDDSKIFGTWAVCSMADSGKMIMFNVCRNITFNFNGNGTVKTAGNLQPFQWSLKNKQLNIHYPYGMTRGLFPDTVYSISFSKYDEIINLTLTSIDGNSELFLNREE